MTTLLANPNQDKLCHANILEREFVIQSVTGDIARRHVISRYRKMLQIFLHQVENLVTTV